MNSASREGHHREELLLKLLSGEIDPEGEEGRRMLKSDPLLKKEYTEIQALPEELDSLAAEEADAVADLAQGLPASPGVDNALAKLRKGNPGFFSRFIPSILTAAAVVAIGITLWVVLADRQERSLQVLGGDFNVVHTTEAVAQYEFSWDAYPLSQGEEFYLFIDAGQGAKKVWHGKETSWIPTAEAAAELPDEITWWVEVIGLNADYPTASSIKVISKRK
ncbi:MAG: hypothetical protein ABIK28_03065 [Planctomycetota bacterium]